MIRRGEIYIADMGARMGSEQGGRRPVLIIQNDIGNEHSPTVICAAITSKKKRYLPVHVPIYAADHELICDSTILLEQIRTIDKRRLLYKIGCLSDAEIERVNRALKVSLEVE